MKTVYFSILPPFSCIRKQLLATGYHHILARVFGHNEKTGHGAYFEMTVIQAAKETVMAIGSTTRPYTLLRLAGWNKCAIGYRSDDGRKFLDDATCGQDYGTTRGEQPKTAANIRWGWGMCLYRTSVLYLERSSDKGRLHGLGTFIPTFPTMGADRFAVVNVHLGQRPFWHSIGPPWPGHFLLKNFCQSVSFYSLGELRADKVVSRGISR